MDTDKYYKLTLPLPPSINAAFTRNKYTHHLAHTPEYKNYLTDAAWVTHAFCKQRGIQPISTYTPIYLFFYLRKANSDSHNYKKCLFDALEQGGLFKNDKFILDRTMEIWIDPLNPRIDVLIAKELPKTQTED